MEIYTNSPNRTVDVRFASIPTAVDAYVYQRGEQIHEFGTVAQNSVDGVTLLSVVFPLYLSQFDGNFEVVWDITYLEEGNTYTVTNTTHVQVVTPLLSRSEIRSVWDTATDAEVIAIERAVRHVIQAHTGQQFGRYVGAYPVSANSSGELVLPRKLLSLDKINGKANVGQFSISPSGWHVRVPPYTVPPVKADIDGLHMHTGGVIHNPNNVSFKSLKAGNVYVVEGVWGWEAVPEPVREAAKLLVNDYACADAQYRDRYLNSMAAADWRLAFNERAFEGTGNARADQLLAEFKVVRGWVVL